MFSWNRVRDKQPLAAAVWKSMLREDNKPIEARLPKLSKKQSCTSLNQTYNYGRIKSKWYENLQGEPCWQPVNHLSWLRLFWVVPVRDNRGKNSLWISKNVLQPTVYNNWYNANAVLDCLAFFSYLYNEIDDIYSNYIRI